MRQILQNLRSGATILADVPAPAAVPGKVVIQTRRSLISMGTERMLVEFGRGSLLAKAKSQPDKVRQVLDKIKTDGLLPTLDTVFRRLDEPLPLGYCNAGVVTAAGQDVTAFSPGDRVVSNGPHAEIAAVPVNLCAKIPGGVTDEQAAFTVLSAIGLQGIRLIQPTLGEKIVVYGLGLIGQITAQLLLANGCRVMGVDLVEQRLELARRFGVFAVPAGSDPVTAADAWSNGRGVDGVLITASATTDDIVHQSAAMCRKRGRIVLVGVVGLNLNRADFYNKELDFQVSCSYGPGRYDDEYELKGHDYPYGFVRWTEQRNFEAVLAMMQSGRLVVDPLITHRYPFAQAPQVYRDMGKAGNTLGIILEYPQDVERKTVLPVLPSVTRNGQQPVLAVIGAGNFSKMTLMPALAKTGARIKYIADLKSDAAAYLAKKYGAENATTDKTLVLEDKDVSAVIIAAGHQVHARMVTDALKAGKNVFVEKPLAMNQSELQDVLQVYQSLTQPLSLMVGFNRRFSPHIVKMKQLLHGRTEPLAMTMTVNAGIIPPDHWVHDPERGGGRIIGEACHFIDLMVFLSESRVKSLSAVLLGEGTAVRDDKTSIVLELADGSIGTVNYFANGSKAYPKERLEVFSQGRVLFLDNFRITTGYGFKGFKKFRTSKQDKGHGHELARYVAFLAEGGAPLIPFDELVNVTSASFAAVEAARERKVVRIL
ncbi:bi-domain-containing oxidoreductase [candidate division KSB1 bacterium]|nr:bi-domain-containing oxidoreductase [candidate division KSB1 bacterium]